MAAPRFIYLARLLYTASIFQEDSHLRFNLWLRKVHFQQKTVPPHLSGRA